MIDFITFIVQYSCSAYYYGSISHLQNTYKIG